MIFSNGQLIYPENFRNPSFTISPFSTAQLEALHQIEEKQQADLELLNTFFGLHEFTMSGKDAISRALSFYGLQPEDEVLIVTTMGNRYVSSCVTKEIEKFCSWSRNYSETRTRLIFVVHEFGTVFRDFSELKKLHLPIIEDYAMSMFSGSSFQREQCGDFAVYSLPKFFPVQFGGLLRCNKPEFAAKFRREVPEDFQIYLQKICTHYLSRSVDLMEKRKTNYRYFEESFRKLNLESRLQLQQDETPSVFMFKSDDIDLDKLKVFLQRHGIECSKFYGENSFFLPVHQELSFFDISYMVNLIKYFANEDCQYHSGKGCDH